MLPPQRIEHIHRRKLACPQRIAIKPDPNIAIELAEEFQARHAGYGFNSGVNLAFQDFCTEGGGSVDFDRDP